jgi:hypothetical protein
MGGDTNEAVYLHFLYSNMQKQNLVKPSVKAACLQMGQNILIKLNLRNMFYDFRKHKMV